MSSVRPEVLRYVDICFPRASLRPIVGDASTRSFYRIRTPSGTTRVLLDYGAAFRGETDDVRLNRIFEQAGLRVARILDVAGEAGCLLLEDLGDRLFERAWGDVERRSRSEARGLMERAVRLAAEVAERGTPVLERSDRALGPALDEDRFRFEMDFYLKHFVEGLCGRDSAAPELQAALHRLADRAAGTPQRVFCHRDYHGRNLLVLPDQRLAMVDIQDARWGPDTYDLASLLRDAYLDLDESWVEPLIDLYLSALEDPPAAEPFRERFDIVAAQRMIKALGTFGYQIGVRGRRRYGDAIPRTLDRLRRLLPERPATARLSELMAELGLFEVPH